MNEGVTVYIYQRGKDNIEVVLTGRVATRTVGRRTFTLHEIKPKDDEDVSFKDWVNVAQLYKIEQKNK